MMRHGYPSPSGKDAGLSPAKPDLSALIAARICHDLISPLGAIGNGVELLELSKTAAGPELALVHDSVQQAQARIRLFRIAFGSVSADQAIGAEELRGILRDYSAQLRFDLDWTPLQSQPKPMVKLGLLALLCLETVLPHGGVAQCSLSQDGLHFIARTERPKLYDALWQALDGGAPWPDDLRAAHVQFPALAQAVTAEGMALRVRTGTDGVDLQITAD
ncbi:histidine phosphotransferase family protein [Roseibaca sp. V10]|uniref:Histidine phosphotransferase family protein n=1 Tax=Roseinatronobacter domitianus TaxID=2940293 RepID=A0ABT0M4G0_9RHOB|nr:histidine phosphotransferase family protein [Roseibaca domitiana]MCL1629741.1 histidine phosphotransferase family protein [Roseibaca domitiana]